MAHSVIPIVSRCGIWIQTGSIVQRKKPTSNGNRNSSGLKKSRVFGQFGSVWSLACCKNYRATGCMLPKDLRREEDIPGCMFSDLFGHFCSKRVWHGRRSCQVFQRPETPTFSPGSGFILAQKYVEPFPHFHDFPPWSLLDTLNCRMS